jgi:hypothetical protein
MSFAIAVAVFAFFVGGFRIKLLFPDLSTSAVENTLSVDAFLVKDASSMDASS